MTVYVDVEIRVLAQETQGYPVEIEVGEGQQFPRGYLDAAALPTLSLSLTTNYLSAGQRLWQWLMADEGLRLSWAKLSGQTPQRRIRLRLDATAPELHILPWELLHDGSAFLAAGINTPFSRYLAGPWRPQPAISETPIRVLAVIANPDNLDKYQLHPVDGEKEWALLTAAATDPRFELVRLAAPITLATLEKELRHGYHILHFVGHGQFARSGKSSFLYLADEQNRAKAVRGEEVVAMLTRLLGGVDAVASASLRLIYLSSCQTATTSPADVFRGLAPQLINTGITTVVAMQDLIPVLTAQAFTRTFYERLAVHGLVDAAANEARAHILTADLPGAAIPVLFSRLTNNQLLSGEYKARLPFEPELIYIPSGPFFMGVDPGANIAECESPCHELYLPAYRLGKYPVTNEQYAEFIRQTNHPLAKETGWFGRTPPADKLTHPVVGVSWLDALTYCQWLSTVTGRAYRLPSEAEWEKAARGADGRLYPWGNEWDPTRCQHNQTGTASVTAHTAGASPYGCEDMLGNASEWTRTLWGPDPIQSAHPYPYKHDQREDITAPGHRLYRGGSFRDTPDRLRCSARSWYAPDHRDRKRGFRVALGDHEG
ncbi:MAG: SUMF1/EgtB/PvdO family nonheme iron enzyme [Chloroflexi bacterium]|nr:SUMF1/EgtB/PvdO family nonheme iron enzyme [Chloroflexota bacterium]MBP8056423.1 SUMF1/EgtB/PvdO family nonheme iron enzyme [Chloroflexota bacterium]